MARQVWILAAVLLLVAHAESHSKLSAARAALKPHTVSQLCID